MNIELEQTIIEQMNTFNCDRSKLLEMYKAECSEFQAEMEKTSEHMKICIVNIKTSIECIDMDIEYYHVYDEVKQLKKHTSILDEYADEYAHDKAEFDDRDKLVKYLEELL
jgi:hypothetical protein